MTVDAYLLDWANLLLRWAHVIVAIAWIGASFYFVLLDASLTPVDDEQLKQRGVDGEMWAVHGGGFYHSNKYLVAPRWRALPERLHWSYWESYSTWLTGFALFTVLYLVNADSFLIDRSVHDWSTAAAIATALAFLVVFWLVYDTICRTLGQRRGGDHLVAAGVLLLVLVAAGLACHWFAGRAAFVLVGAMLATAMSANVFFWIIPGQRKVVADLVAGRAPAAIHGQRAKQRSVHNTYFTLPVLVAMLSNHYPWLTRAEHNAAVLVALMAAGALIRHSFVARHRAHAQGRRTPWEYALLGTLVLAGLAVALAPAPAAPTPAARPVAFAEVQSIVTQRCVPCHNAQLQQKGVALHTPELIRHHAQNLYQQAVVAKTMPFNNATLITDAERAALKQWFEAGARP